jgi:hypothetical protein
MQLRQLAQPNLLHDRRLACAAELADAAQLKQHARTRERGRIS